MSETDHLSKEDLLRMLKQANIHIFKVREYLISHSTTDGVLRCDVREVLRIIEGM